MFDGQAVSNTDTPSFDQSKPILLSGKTVANGKVTIYVFSEPKKYSVAADETGNWSYELIGLSPGSHHVEAEVTDPKSGKTSPRTQILAFSIMASVGVSEIPHDIVQTSQKASKLSLPLLIAIAGAVVVLAVSLYFAIHKYGLLRKNKKTMT
jgi:hypothetical protein